MERREALLQEIKKLLMGTAGEAAKLDAAALMVEVPFEATQRIRPALVVTATVLTVRALELVARTGLLDIGELALNLVDKLFFYGHISCLCVLCNSTIKIVFCKSHNP